MASVPVYCLCGQPYDSARFMIQCDVCKEWFHGSCVDLKEHQSEDIEKYHCPRCTKIFGPSAWKKRTNWHRHDFTEDGAVNKAVQTGTPVFIKEIKTRHFPSADPIILKLRGSQLTLSYLEEHGFASPILVDRRDGLGLTVPPDSFSVNEVESYIGADREVDVIDVGKQDTLRMTLHEFVECFNSPNQEKVLNLISLEFSTTRLSELVEAPYIVRKLSWVNTVWPDYLPEDCPYEKPEVQKYCLLGMKDSYTDFHIDFGGTSVWYHVLKGEKVFYLIQPTPANVALYEQWMSSATQSETFFGDQVDACSRCVVRQGHTLFIPTGWIHAVLTPVESLVFGGNFLHDHNIPLQLQIHELEKRINTPEKYRFPSLETVTWYAAKHLLERLKACNSGDARPPLHIIQGVKALIATLRSWTQNKEFMKTHKASLPENIQHGKLIKDLNKEFRQAEKPIKPHEDKRKRKRKEVEPHFDVPNLGVKVEPVEMEIDLKPLIIPDLALLDHKPPTTVSVPDCLPEPTGFLSPTSNGTSSMKPPPPVSPFTLWIAKDKAPNTKAAAGLKVKLPKGSPNKAKGGLTFASPTRKRASPATPSTPSPRKNSSISPHKDDSVYEFKDSDDESLVVDEHPPKQRFAGKVPNAENEKQEPLKLRLSFNGKMTAAKQKALENDNEDIDITSFSKNSGIEELLRASGYATDTDCKLDEELSPVDSLLPSNGRASPSTREAIQGMLSIGCAVQFSTLTTSGGSSQRPASTATNSASHTRRQRQRKFILSDDVGENMDKCHQDEEYVYPTLDASDDEIHVFKPRGRVKRDEPWNPKAKLVPNCPKPERPVREGVRKEAVESGLAAAAAKLAHMPRPKRPYHRKKSSSRPKVPAKEELEVPPSTSATITVATTPSVTSLDGGPVGKKPKKGMATAKQRLGRILKIHKMLH